MARISTQASRRSVYLIDSPCSRVLLTQRGAALRGGACNCQALVQVPTGSTQQHSTSSQLLTAAHRLRCDCSTIWSVAASDPPRPTHIFVFQDLACRCVLSMHFPSSIAPLPKLDDVQGLLVA